MPKKAFNEYYHELFIYWAAKKQKRQEWATDLKQYYIYASYLSVSLEIRWNVNVDTSYSIPPNFQPIWKIHWKQQI